MKRSIPQLGTRFHDIDAGLNTTVVQPGQNIQDALDSVALTGGKVFLKNGVHYPVGDLVMASNVFLEGETAFGAVIDFGAQPYSLRIEGANAYITGTINTDGSNILTGVDTVWGGEIIGQYILLDGDYYYIMAVDSPTQITLGSDFAGGTKTGLSYVISSPINGCLVSTMTIQNSISSLVKIQYGLAIGFEKVELYSADIGFEVRDTVSFFYEAGDVVGFNTGMYLNNCYSYSLNTFYVASCVLDGMDLIGGGDSTLLNFGVSNCGGVGMKFTNTEVDSVMSFTIDNNGSHGIEMSDGNLGNQFVGGSIENNGGDGIKFTSNSDATVLNSLIVKDNAGYGVNVPNANCDNNILLASILSGNFLGQVSNSGTTTKIRSNIGVNDN
jgi:hypothetical protein